MLGTAPLIPRVRQPAAVRSISAFRISCIIWIIKNSISQAPPADRLPGALNTAGNAASGPFAAGCGPPALCPPPVASPHAFSLPAPCARVPRAFSLPRPLPGTTRPSSSAPPHPGTTRPSSSAPHIRAPHAPPLPRPLPDAPRFSPSLARFTFFLHYCGIGYYLPGLS